MISSPLVSRVWFNLGRVYCLQFLSLGFRVQASLKRGVLKKRAGISGEWQRCCGKRSKDSTGAIPKLTKLGPFLWSSYLEKQFAITGVCSGTVFFGNAHGGTQPFMTEREVKGLCCNRLVY